jgi:lipoprotein-releasing system ATP-binding protein
MSDLGVDVEVTVEEAEQEIPILFLHDVERHYSQGDATLNILNGAELALWAGQSVALVAPSGAGKSTLLHLAGLLEHPDHGEVYIDGRATAILPDAERTRIRRNEIGFVYQSHHLLPEFTALENVLMPQLIRGLSRGEAKTRAVELLDYLGLKGRLNHRPAEMSGGEQQRVAIARAFANAPRILFADEPTGNLDSETGSRIVELLEELNRESKTTIILVTHDLTLANRAQRIIRLSDGRVISDSATEQAA